MAGKRIKMVDMGGHNTVPTLRFQTDAAATIIEKGMLLKLTSNGSPYVTPLVTADHTIGTDTAIVGLAAGDSTHTSLVDGYIDVYMPLPGIVYEIFAETAANIDTQAKLDLLIGDRLTLTISATTSAGDWTLNEDAGEVQTAAFHLIDGDYERGTCKFIIRHGGTILGDQDLA